MKSLAALALLLLVGACASVPMATADADLQAKQFQPPPDGQGTLYIYREGIFGAAVLLTASLGQRLLGQLGADTYFKVDVPPGQYDARCTGGESSQATIVTVAPGETRFVEVAARMGFAAARCAIFEVSAEKGRAAISHGKRAAEIR
jgi:hypothetical protein